MAGASTKSLLHSGLPGKDLDAAAVHPELAQVCSELLVYSDQQLHPLARYLDPYGPKASTGSRRITMELPGEG